MAGSNCRFCYCGDGASSENGTEISKGRCASARQQHEVTEETLGDEVALCLHSLGERVGAVE